MSEKLGKVLERQALDPPIRVSIEKLDNGEKKHFKKHQRITGFLGEIREMISEDNRELHETLSRIQRLYDPYPVAVKSFFEHVDIDTPSSKIYQHEIAEKLKELAADILEASGRETNTVKNIRVVSTVDTALDWHGVDMFVIWKDLKRDDIQALFEDLNDEARKGIKEQELKKLPDSATYFIGIDITRNTKKSDAWKQFAKEAQQRNQAPIWKFKKWSTDGVLPFSKNINEYRNDEIESLAYDHTDDLFYTYMFHALTNHERNLTNINSSVMDEAYSERLSVVRTCIEQCLEKVFIYKAGKKPSTTGEADHSVHQLAQCTKKKCNM